MHLSVKRCQEQTKVWSDKADYGERIKSCYNRAAPIVLNIRLHWPLSGILNLSSLYPPLPLSPVSVSLPASSPSLPFSSSICVYVCSDACEGQRSMSSVFFNSFPLYYYVTVSQGHWNSWIQPEELARKFQQSSCLCLFSARIIGGWSLIRLIPRVLGIWTGILSLAQSVLADSIISSASITKHVVSDMRKHS